MKRLVLVLALLSLVAAGCSDDNSVGKDVDLGLESQVDQQRIGARTTTTAAPATTQPPPDSKAAVGDRVTTTTQAPVTTSPPVTAQSVAIEISINDDDAGTQFDPSQARVFVGSLVKWTNRDPEKKRSVVADDGSFNSGLLEPGQSFTYKATKVGKFNYTDESRPYAVAYLEVLER